MSKEQLEEIIENLPYSIRHEGNVESLIEFAKEKYEQNKRYKKTLQKTRQRLLRLPWFKGTDAHVTIKVINEALEESE